jgi:hypothetical protein
VCPPGCKDFGADVIRKDTRRANGSYTQRRAFYTYVVIVVLYENRRVTHSIELTSWRLHVRIYIVHEEPILLGSHPKTSR